MEKFAMKIFDVYENKVGDVKAIKRGFCWPALFFTAFWAFVAGLPGYGAILIIISIVLRVLLAIAEGTGSLNLQFVIVLAYCLISIYIGDSGNDWRRNKLAKKGYTLKKVVKASSKRNAYEAPRTSRKGNRQI